MRRKKLEAMLTKSVRYSPSLNAGYGLETAQKIGCEIEAMMSEGVAITPVNLLARSTDPDSPLHSLFTWNDANAAHKQRLHEARQILAKLNIVVKKGDVEVVEPALWSMRITDAREGEEEFFKRKYVFIEEVEVSPDYRAQIEEEAWKAFRHLAEKYARWNIPKIDQICAIVLGMEKDVKEAIEA